MEFCVYDTCLSCKVGLYLLYGLRFCLATFTRGLLRLIDYNGLVALNCYHCQSKQSLIAWIVIIFLIHYDSSVEESWPRGSCSPSIGYKKAILSLLCTCQFFCYSDCSSCQKFCRFNFCSRGNLQKFQHNKNFCVYGINIFCLYALYL